MPVAPQNPAHGLRLFAGQAADVPYRLKRAPHFVHHAFLFSRRKSSPNGNNANPASTIHGLAESRITKSDPQQAHDRM